MKKLTPIELEALRTLDIVANDSVANQEGGWVGIRAVQAELTIGYVWTAQLLQSLRQKGYALARPPQGDQRKLVYTTSAAGDCKLAEALVAA